MFVFIRAITKVAIPYTSGSQSIVKMRAYDLEIGRNPLHFRVTVHRKREVWQELGGGRNPLHFRVTVHRPAIIKATITSVAIPCTSGSQSIEVDAMDSRVPNVAIPYTSGSQSIAL